MAWKHTSPSPLLLAHNLRAVDVASKTYGTCTVKTRLWMTTSEVQLNTYRMKRQQKNIHEQKCTGVIKV